MESIKDEFLKEMATVGRISQCRLGPETVSSEKIFKEAGILSERDLNRLLNEAGIGGLQLQRRIRQKVLKECISYLSNYDEFSKQHLRMKRKSQDDPAKDFQELKGMQIWGLFRALQISPKRILRMHHREPFQSGLPVAWAILRRSEEKMLAALHPVIGTLNSVSRTEPWEFDINGRSLISIWVAKLTRHLRESMNLNKSRFATKAGLHSQNITDIERGKIRGFDNESKLSKLKKIAAACDFDCELFFIPVASPKEVLQAYREDRQSWRERFKKYDDMTEIDVLLVLQSLIENS